MAQSAKEGEEKRGSARYLVVGCHREGWDEEVEGGCSCLRNV